jgi:hypothetical protein
VTSPFDPKLSRMALTSADPTATPSAPTARALAWAGVVTPKPTTTGSLVDLRMRAMWAWTAATSGAAVPVMPVMETY